MFPPKLLYIEVKLKEAILQTIFKGKQTFKVSATPDDGRKKRTGAGLLTSALFSLNPNRSMPETHISPPIYSSAGLQNQL